MVHHAAATSFVVVFTLVFPLSRRHAQQVAQDTGSMSNKITVMIGEQAFAATLADSTVTRRVPAHLLLRRADGD